MLAPKGALDIATVTEAHKRLIGLDLPPRGELVLDLSEVTFMDSTGIRLLLQAREHAYRCAASYVIVRGPDDVMRIVELVGLDDQLHIVASHPCQGAAMPVR